MWKIDSDKAHKTLGQFILTDGMPLIYDIKKSKGSYLHDSRSGKDYLDCFSFFASMPLTHNHPKMADEHFIKQLIEVAGLRPSNSDVYTQPMAGFVKTFGDHAAAPHFDYLFFIDGGALAVENTLKAAFDWKVRQLGREKEADVNNLEIIHFKEAFHGRSGYTMSLTNTSDPRKYQHFPKFDWPRISNPKITFPLNDANLAAVKELEAKALEEIEAVLKKKGDKIAGLIIEPIQGEGGDNQFRQEFLQHLRQLADEHHFLLIFDEVQTGFGMTGKFWCFEHYGVVPDLIAFGKKSQVCGVAATKRMDEVQGHVFAESSRINSTWGGNLVDMVRCRRYLEIIAEDNLVAHAAETGAYGLSLLQEMQLRHPSVVSNCRGLGLMLAFDLPNRQQRDTFINKLFENRLIALGCGTRSVRLRPHLDVSKQDLARAIEIMDDLAKTVS